MRKYIIMVIMALCLTACGGGKGQGPVQTQEGQALLSLLEETAEELHKDGTLTNEETYTNLLAYLRIMALWDVADENTKAHARGSYSLAVTYAAYLSKYGGDYQNFGENALLIIDPVINKDDTEFHRIIAELDKLAHGIILKNNREGTKVRGTLEQEEAIDTKLSYGFITGRATEITDDEKEKAFQTFQLAFRELEDKGMEEAAKDDFTLSELVRTSTYFALVEAPGSAGAYISECGIEMMRAAIRGNQYAWDSAIKYLHEEAGL